MKKYRTAYQAWELVIYFSLVLAGFLLLNSTLGFETTLGIGLILLAEKL